MRFPVRFRIRTLLLAVALAAAVAAWPAAEWRKWYREQAITRRLMQKDVQVTTARLSSWPFPPRVTRVSADEYLRLSPSSGSPDQPRPKSFQLTAGDMDDIASLDELRELDLHGDVLETTAYPSLGKLTQLRALRISQGGWDDERLPFLAGLTGLEELSLEQTQTTGDRAF